ncbi:small multi-drug export protein [Salicibibacter cibarius]|uniref:Small multi-drug export protein n=1 Tax=Salicibibacter cibarius TaxID=2743000 RepID=A0A7T6Z813_9BACI|nr:small multi-drug export protein [Salicibibacter cibarius]QQK78071.1 small multi-drug export protein [Salicibibacter cibarius]
MDYLTYFILVFLGAAVPFIEYMTVIPLGIIIGLPLVPTVFLGFLGNLVTVLLVIILVDKIREVLRKRKKQHTRLPDTDGESTSNPEEANTTEMNWDESFTSKRRRRAQKLWDKYGLPGLTVIGTGLLSSHLTALMACTFGGNRTYVFIWMTISLALWSIILGIAFQLGMDAIFS